VLRDVLARHPALIHVPLQRATEHTGRAYRSADFFHPNDRGHRRYADTFWAALAHRRAVVAPWLPPEVASEV
jgi:hypothetical protein